jgi:hypothetical protein
MIEAIFTDKLLDIQILAQDRLERSKDIERARLTTLLRCVEQLVHGYTS